MRQSFLKSLDAYNEDDFIALDMIIFCSFIVFFAVYVVGVTL